MLTSLRRFNPLRGDNDVDGSELRAVVQVDLQLDRTERQCAALHREDVLVVLRVVLELVARPSGRLRGRRAADQVAVAVETLVRQRAGAVLHRLTVAVLERELHRYRVGLAELRARQRAEEPAELVLADEDRLRRRLDLP